MVLLDDPVTSSVNQISLAFLLGKERNRTHSKLFKYSIHGWFQYSTRRPLSSKNNGVVHYHVRYRDGDGLVVMVRVFVTALLFVADSQSLAAVNKIVDKNSSMGRCACGTVLYGSKVNLFFATFVLAVRTCT